MTERQRFEFLVERHLAGFAADDPMPPAIRRRYAEWHARRAVFPDVLIDEARAATEDDERSSYRSAGMGGNPDGCADDVRDRGKQGRDIDIAWFAPSPAARPRGAGGSGAAPGFGGVDADEAGYGFGVLAAAVSVLYLGVDRLGRGPRPLQFVLRRLRVFQAIGRAIG